MERRSTYTIKSLLEELKQGLPDFTVGMIFETHKPIYPTAKTPREQRNITYKDTSFTKPLAVDRKSKSNLVKEDSPAKDFFKDYERGDFLKVIKINNNKTAECINLSLKEGIVEQFYKEETLTVSYDMVADGTLKIYKRRVDKYLK